MEITPDKRHITELVKLAREGKMVLPQFQRNFVWARDDVTDFLISILRGYFIGSFLVQRCDRENIPFAMRPIEGVNIPYEMLNPEHMVLDGQQRLTTLHYVLYNPEGITLKSSKHPYRFFLDLNKIVTGEIEEAIMSERENRTKKWFEERWQFENKIIPFSSLKDFKTWDSWLDRYQDWLREQSKENYIEFSEKIRPQWKISVGKLFDCEVPFIEIPKVRTDDEEKIAEVCAIFEKMNSTGVALSVFDLLTARLYKYRDLNIDLHKLWKETVEDYDLIEQFSEGEPNPYYGIFILRFIALIRGLDVKSKILINLKPKNFEAEWKLGAKYINKALERVTATNQDGFGVFDPKWSPYPPMLVVLAAALYQIDEQKLDSHAIAVVKKWYWGSVFGERYQSAVESTTLKDYADLVKEMVKQEKQTDTFKEIDTLITDNPNFTLADVYRINSKYKGVMNLLALNGAQDFRLNDSIEFYELDDHHIFPKNFVKKQKDSNGARRYTDREINVVLNRTLISARTNRKIQDKSTQAYLADESIIGQNIKGEILKKHFINEKALAAMQSNDYDIFLRERDSEFTARIKGIMKL